MRELPILFTKDNRVKCIAGDKTQTRRVIVPQPPQEFCRGDVAAVCNSQGLWAIARSKFSADGPGSWPPDPKPGIKPKYQVGDHLWMLEPYRIVGWACRRKWERKLCGYYLDGDPEATTGWLLRKELTVKEYKKWLDRKFPYRSTSSRFMYKSLARHWFEVIDVRVEWVQDISTADICAEGVDNGMSNPTMGIRHANMQRQAFKDLWDSINKKRGFGWDTNPLNFVYEFKRIER